MSERPPRRWAASLTGLSLALLVPAVVSSLPAAVEIPETANVNAIPAVLLNEAGVWILTFMVLAIVRFWERRPFSSIGFVRPSWRAIDRKSVV